MAHEFGHFDDYLNNSYSQVSDNKKIETVVMFVLASYIFIMIMALSLLLATVFKSTDTKNALTLSLFITFIACEIINYITEVGFNFCDVIQSHHNEYKADRYAYNFLKDVLIKNVFLYEGAMLHVSKSHPSHFQRIIYLKYNLKIYIPFFHFKYLENKLILKCLFLELIKKVIPRTIVNK